MYIWYFWWFVPNKLPVVYGKKIPSGCTIFMKSSVTLPRKLYKIKIKGFLSVGLSAMWTLWNICVASYFVYYWLTCPFIQHIRIFKTWYEDILKLNFKMCNISFQRYILQWISLCANSYFNILHQTLAPRAINFLYLQEQFCKSERSINGDTLIGQYTDHALPLYLPPSLHTHTHISLYILFNAIRQLLPPLYVQHAWLISPSPLICLLRPLLLNISFHTLDCRR